MVKGRYEKMKKIESLMIFSLVCFLISFGGEKSYGEGIYEALEPIKTVEYRKPGEEGGQCAEFVQWSRPELLGFGNAKDMPDRAEAEGFVVNGIPRVGAILVIRSESLAKNGVGYGHAEFVEEVKPIYKNGKIEKYELKIRDSNVKARYDSKGNEITKDGIVRERTVYYTPGGKFGYGTFEDPELAKDTGVIGFIHEKKEDFDKKVASLIKNISGVEPTKSEIESYADRIRRGEILTTEQLKTSLEISNIIHLTTANSTTAIVQLSQNQAPQFPKTLLTTALSTPSISPELAKKISLDSSQFSERTAQQLLTPVNVSFTQIFDGLFTQSADYLGSIGGDHSGIFTDGTRIGAGSRPGDFTSGSFSGRTIAEPGYTPATWTNEPFSGSSVGTATARGFQEGDLKGDMTITVPAGTQTATLSGKITIKTDGSLDMPSYSGPITDSSIGGQKVGTMSGSGNQGPTH
jgi:hypothetical protein